MDRTNSGPSRGTHRSPLVALRAVEFCCSSDSTQAARETTEVVVGDCSCCLTACPRLNGVLPNSPVAACDPQIGPKTVRIGSLRPLYAPKNALELSFSTA